MAKTKRSFTAEERLSILKEGERQGQEFTHIATPEENAYIESFHSIFERDVIQRFEFSSYYDAKLTIMAYMDYYNNRRRHGSLGRKTPMQKWNEYYGSFSSNKQPEAQVSEGLSRV